MTDQYHRLPGDAPRRAMVLAAGLGLRMRPLTLTRPKPLVQVGGQTLLDHALDRLASAGVEDAVVNAHWLADQVEAHLAARTRAPRTHLSREETLLETAGGIRKALPLLGDAPFYVVNSDVLWLDGPVPALTRLARRWDPAEMDFLLLLMPTVWAVGYEGRGDYHMDPAGRLRYRGGDGIAPFVAAGVMIARPDAYRDLPEGRLGNAALWHAAEASGRLYGLRHDGPWFHVGTPDSLAEVDAQVRQPRVRWAEP